MIYLLFEPGDRCRLVDGRSKGGEEKKKMVNNTGSHSCTVESDQRASAVLYFRKKPLMV